MKKSDLKSGMIVELRNGEKALVMEDRLVGNGTDSTYWGELKNFNDDLTGSSRSKDIVRVYSVPTNRWAGSFNTGREVRKELWNELVKIVLNEDYTAEIDVASGTVKVGCQKFNKEKIVEIYNALHGIN